MSILRNQFSIFKNFYLQLRHNTFHHDLVGEHKLNKNLTPDGFKEWQKCPSMTISTATPTHEKHKYIVINLLSHLSVN